VIEMVVDSNGSVASSSIYRAVVRNKAQLTYNAVGAWLEGRSGPDAKVGECGVAGSLKLQDEAATALRGQRIGSAHSTSTASKRWLP